MEKKYSFGLNLLYAGKNPFLIINPLANYRKGKSIPYPIDFVKLSVPVIFDKSAPTEFDLEYYLDFDNAVNEHGESYKNSYRKKKLLRKVLNDFMIGADKIIRKALINRTELRNKRFDIKTDNGLESPSKPKRGMLPFDGKHGKAKTHQKKSIGII